MLSPLARKTKGWGARLGEGEDDGTLSPFFYWVVVHPTQWSTRLDCSNPPKSTRTKGCAKSLPAAQLITNKAQDLLPQLVASDTLERWRQTRTGGSWGAQASSSSASSHSGNKCLETEYRLPLGELLSTEQDTALLRLEVSKHSPGQHWSTSSVNNLNLARNMDYSRGGLPLCLSLETTSLPSNTSSLTTTSMGPKVEKMMSTTGREGQTPLEEEAREACLKNHVIIAELYLHDFCQEAACKNQVPKCTSGSSLELPTPLST